MNDEQHRAWLAELAAEDLRRRREAEPALARKEAALRIARGELESSQAAVRDLEAELAAAKREDGDANDP